MGNLEQFRRSIIYKSAIFLGAFFIFMAFFTGGLWLFTMGDEALKVSATMYKLSAFSFFWGFLLVALAVVLAEIYYMGKSNDSTFGKIMELIRSLGDD